MILHYLREVHCLDDKTWSLHPGFVVEFLANVKALSLLLGLYQENKL